METFKDFYRIVNEDVRGDLETNARVIFGADDEPFYRGYIYNNGEFLNMGREMDHREISSAYYPEENGHPELKEIHLPDEFTVDVARSMIGFMYYCKAIRWAIVDNNALVMSYIHKPNSSQKAAITKLIDVKGIDYASIDQYDMNYNTVRSVEGDVWDEEVQSML